MSQTLSPETKSLHQALIRLAKGMISAWEVWLYGDEYVKDKEEKKRK